MGCVIALDRLEPLHGRNVPGPYLQNFNILRTTKNTLKTSHAPDLPDLLDLPDLVITLHTFHLLYLHILKRFPELWSRYVRGRLMRS